MATALCPYAPFATIGSRFSPYFAYPELRLVTMPSKNHSPVDLTQDANSGTADTVAEFKSTEASFKTRSLTLNGRVFANNLIQGPLAGVSCAPFRLLTWRYSQPAYTCTEMISCKTLLHQSLKQRQRFTTKYSHEGPVCFQLSGNNPGELATATQIATDAGADLIDLNCGCPVKKIRQKGAGSRLLTDPSTLYRLIVAMKNHTHLPVSIKIRVEGNGSEAFHEELIKVIHDTGLDFLIVHGRHWTEHYDTPCHYEDIRFFVDSLSIPVIGNGDVADVISLKKMLATGCAGAMIGRAGVGQPWLIAELGHLLDEHPFNRPENGEIAELFIEHIQLLSALLENELFAILQARKLAKYYGRRLAERTQFCLAVNECRSLIEFSSICKQFFKQ
jgi:tRNA-dihydrouridine synthase B